MPILYGCLNCLNCTKMPKTNVFCQFNSFFKSLCSMQHALCAPSYPINPQHVPRNPHHATRNPQPDIRRLKTDIRRQRSDVRRQNSFLRNSTRLSSSQAAVLCSLNLALCPLGLPPYAVQHIPDTRNLKPFTDNPRPSLSSSPLHSFPPSWPIYLGTAIVFKISPITSLTVRPSISNSGRSIRRCSNTGGAMVLTSSGVMKSRPFIAA